MDDKEEILKLLDSLKEMGFDRRQIEQELDYRSEYLDQIISKGGNKKILGRLQKFYLEKSNTNDSIIQKISDVGQEIGELKIKYLALEAKFNILLPAFADISAKFQEKEFSQVYNGLLRATDVEFAELKASLKERE
jgi:hypothetical protein